MAGTTTWRHTKCTLATKTEAGGWLSLVSMRKLLHTSLWPPINGKSSRWLTNEFIHRSRLLLLFILTFRCDCVQRKFLRTLIHLYVLNVICLIVMVGCELLLIIQWNKMKISWSCYIPVSIYIHMYPSYINLTIFSIFTFVSSYIFILNLCMKLKSIKPWLY